MALPEWTAAALHDALRATAGALGLKLGKVAQPLRVAVSGGGVSPPMDATLEVLGRETSLARLDRAIGWIGTASAETDLGILVDSPGSKPENTRPAWGYSSAGRALAWHARGRRFDPG